MEDIWEYVNANPGCPSRELRGVVGNHCRAGEIRAAIADLAEKGKVLHEIKNPNHTYGRTTYVWFTQSQLKERGLWPIPDNMKPEH